MPESLVGVDRSQYSSRYEGFSRRSLLAPYLLAACVYILFLFAFHIVLLQMFIHGALDRHPFSLKKLGFVGQIIALSTQAISVVLLAAVGFVIQAVSSDQVVRRCKCFAKPSKVRFTILNTSSNVGQTVSGKFSIRRLLGFILYQCSGNHRFARHSACLVRSGCSDDVTVQAIELLAPCKTQHNNHPGLLSG